MSEESVLAVALGFVVALVVYLCCLNCVCVCSIKYLCDKAHQRKEEKREREKARERDLKRRRSRNAENQQRQLELEQTIAQQNRGLSQQYAMNASQGE